MTATDTTTEIPSLHSLACHAYREADGNIAVARAAIMARLERDPDLLEHLVSVALASAVNSLLNAEATAHRNKIVRAAMAPPNLKRANVIALATGLRAGYLDWPLANGIKLRDARRADLAMSIERYSSVAASNATRAKWLQLVLQSIPDDTVTVGERLTETRIAELYKEVSDHA